MWGTEINSDLHLVLQFFYVRFCLNRKLTGHCFRTVTGFDIYILLLFLIIVLLFNDICIVKFNISLDLLNHCSYICIVI